MKSLLSILILYSSLLFFGQENTANAQETNEQYSELYFMHGIQISKRFCYIGAPGVCEEGEVVDSDTLKTSFLVLLTFNPDNPDSVLFDGLEGANTRPREMIPKGFNGGSAVSSNCDPTIDCGYARKTGPDLEFYISSPVGNYAGTGTIENDRLTLQTGYTYRGSGADYILEGTKIEDER